MKIRIIWVIALPLIFTTFRVCAQDKLQPGFNAIEYNDLLELASESVKDHTKSFVNFYHKYQLVHKSPEIGLYNQFAFWLRSDSVGVICIRGTIGKAESWMENFYSAMIPATGSLQLNDSTTFHYKLSKVPKAYVHVGWTLGLSFLAPRIVKILRENYSKGMKEVIIMGHSQGAGIAFLLRSYLEYIDVSLLPNDIRFKSYLSGAPKPGNLYYAYDFDFITRNQMGFRIVNPEDWVPETPLSVQTIEDMNDPNILIDYKQSIKSMNFFVRWYVNRAYNRTNRTTTKSVKYYKKYLGTIVYKQIKKKLSGFREPEYVNSNSYMTAGCPVVLVPDSIYHTRFKFTGKNIFVHHQLDPYQYLLNLNYPNSKNQ